MSSIGISEEELNAFVDGELSTTTRARVLEALDHDALLQKRVAEIQQTKNLLRHSYERPPLPRAVVAIGPFWKNHKMAASVLISIGMITGALLNLLAVNSTTLLAAGPPKGVVIQVSEADPAKWEMALINARNARAAYADQDVGVEIVAYGPGLKMLRNDSAVASGLEEARQNGVKLFACGKSMTMAQMTRNELNPAVAIVPAGIVEIMERQQEGYAYVRP